MKYIGISFFLLLLLVSFINAKTKELKETNKPCPPSIIKAGYKCCKHDCKVIYTDEDGLWGVEDNNWCGCYNSSTKNTNTTKKTTTKNKTKKTKTKTTTLTKTITTTTTTTIIRTSKPTTTTEISTTFTETPTTTTEISTTLTTTTTTEIPTTFTENPTTTTEAVPTETSVTINQNQDGTIGNRDYSLWANNGEVSATFNADGSYNCSFKDTSNVLCRFGLNLDESKSFKEIDGTVYAKFELAEQEVEGSDYTFVGVYGRSNSKDNYLNIITEFYIVDYWVDPYHTESNVIKYGSFEIDNAKYTVYEKSFSLSGNNIVKQYISYRKEPRTSGTINVSAHVDFFGKIGMNLFGILEVKVIGEANSQDNSATGFFNFAYSEVMIEPNEISTPSTVKEVTVKGVNGGTLEGRDFTLWMGEGNCSATFRSDGSYYCRFENTMEMLCRYGIDFDQTKKHQEIGQIYAEFDLKEKAYKHTDYSYVGVYGVSRNVKDNLNPYIEFYIIESRSGQHYPEDKRTINHGEVEIDGAIYTVYEKQVTNEDSILIIKQYVSIRKEKRTSGTVNVSAHLEYWESLGMNLYEIFEVKVLAEVGSMNILASGFFDFAYSNVYVEPTEASIAASATTVTSSTTAVPSKPSSITLFENGNGIIGDKYYALWGYGSSMNSAIYNSDGSFSCAFENENDIIFNLGILFDADKPYQEIGGPIYASFEIVQQEVENADYVFIGAYGWIKEEEHSTGALVEFFIIDEWNRPYSEIYKDSEEYGDYMIDDAMYTVYKNVQKYLTPPITQYVSVRKEKRTSGTINVSAHIDNWEKLGMKTYGLSEVKVFANSGSENSKATGTISFYASDVYVQGGEESSNPATTATAPPTSASTEAPANENTECSILIQEAGYPCCKSDCFILYYDVYGSWGIDKYVGWCGCGNEPINDIIPPGVTEIINNPLPPEIKFSYP